MESVQQLIAHFDRLIDELEKQINQVSTAFDETLKKFNDIKGIGTAAVRVDGWQCETCMA